MIAAANLVHAAVHLREALGFEDLVSCEEHGHCHDRGAASDDSDSGDSHGDQHRLCDHSHSPAILESACGLVFCGAVPVAEPQSAALPEPPVGEIEYPPQLS